MDTNRDLSIIFGCMSKGRKSLQSKVQQTDEDLNEVSWSPSNNSTTNFCNLDLSSKKYSKPKKNLLERRYTNEFGSITTDSNLLSSSVSSSRTPIDRYNLVYFTLILNGICFLLPYNSFMIAVDFFLDHFPNSTIVYDISSVYIIVQFIAVCINNTFVSLISFKVRIFSGYLLSLITLTVVSIFEIGYDLFTSENGYHWNLVCVAIMAFGCTVQQSSFYGFSSMLPRSYTQGIMIGESLSGLLVSFSRILTKYFIKDEQLNTLIFFTISIFVIVICFVTSYLIKDDLFIKFYVNNCKKETSNLDFYLSTASLSTPNKFRDEENNIELIVKLDESGEMVATEQNVKKSDSTELSNLPFGIDELDDESFYIQQKQKSPELETNLISQISLQDDQTKETNTQSKKLTSNTDQERKILSFIGQFFVCAIYFRQNFMQGLESRIKLMRLIYPYMLSISLTYLLSISLFPGVESEIESCKLKTWTPVILFLIFNLFDVIGKISAKYLLNISSQKLIFFSSIRFFLLPAFILCIVPNDQPILSNFFFISFFTSILGISNGIFGSLPMILAPNYVINKELAGNLMTLSYCVGLTLGTLLSYVIEFLFFDVKHFKVSRCVSDHD